MSMKRHKVKTMSPSRKGGKSGGGAGGGSGSEDVSAALDSAAKKLVSLAHQGLEHAARMGASESRISCGASFEKRLVVEAGEFTLANSLESRSLGIVVHKDKKKGSASINSDDSAAVNQAVDDALALAEFSVPDEFLCLATKKDAPVAPTLDFLFDPDMAQLELEHVQGPAQEILGVLLRDKRVALDRFEIGMTVSWHAHLNSHGVIQRERQTMAQWQFMGMARDGSEVTGYDFDGSFSFVRDEIQEFGMSDAEEFAQRLVRMLNPRKCPSYRGPVLLSPRAVRELLLGMILYHAGGRQVMDGKSRWEDKVGKRVLPTLFSLSDHPHDARFAGATAFDADSIPTQAQAIIESGLLVNHLHDLYSARRCSTHGVVKGSTATAGGPFSMKVHPGTTPLAEMTKGLDHVLMVDRFAGNSDPIKGDFSGVAKNSRVIIRGEDAGAVTETMIAGNFFELAEKILAASDRAEILSGSFMSPYLLVDGVSVTGQG